ncbi:MAG: hypothetical protein ACE5I1_01885 [bacterium]
MEIGPLSFDAQPALFFLSGAISLLFLVVLSVLLLRQQDKRRIALRLAMNAIATLSLLCVLWQPRWESRPRPAAALIITPGSDRQSLKSLSDSDAFHEYVFNAGSQAKWANIFPAIKRIPDINFLVRHFPEIEKFHIAGYGLKNFDLEQLTEKRLIYDPPTIENGISAIHWNRNIIKGELMKVTGRLSKLDGEAFRLYLLDLSGVADSIKIAENDVPEFTLVARPRDTGKFLYTIRLVNAKQKITLEEKIDVVVREPAPLKLMIVESAPSFETRHLKAWLRTNGHAVAIRTAISRERHRIEFHNLPEEAVSHLTGSLLDQFDLLMIDNKALLNLTPNEQRALRTAISNGGLGLLLFPDDGMLNAEKKSGRTSKFFMDFSFQIVNDLDDREVKPAWPGYPVKIHSPIPAAAFALASSSGLKPLIRDGQDNILAGLKVRGSGRIGISLIKDTYRWILEGNPDFHAAYWSHLLSEIAKKPRKSDLLTLSGDGWYFVDEPVSFCATSLQERPVVYIQDQNEGKTKMSLKQDKDEPSRWWGQYWPVQSGWHEIASQNGARLGFYVHNKSEWQTLQNAQKMQATARFAYLNLLQNGASRQPLQKTRVPVPLHWFFIVFFVTCTVLWAEIKW